MSRAPLSAVLLALAVGGAAVAGEARAATRQHADAQPGATSATLVLSRAAIVAAVRRTAVADPDLDGEVSSLEAAKYHETRFRLLDENADGAIDGSEFLGAVAVRSLYAVVDGFSRPRPLAFESVDVDGNGAVTPEEYLRAEMVRRAGAGRDSRRQAIFQAVDTDHDGLLSREEFVAAGREGFSGSDADGDGKVTIWEFYAATRL